jgi:hypothetical protein
VPIEADLAGDGFLSVFPPRSCFGLQVLHRHPAASRVSNGARLSHEGGLADARGSLHR